MYNERKEERRHTNSIGDDRIRMARGWNLSSKQILDDYVIEGPSN